MLSLHQGQLVLQLSSRVKAPTKATACSRLEHLVSGIRTVLAFEHRLTHLAALFSENKIDRIAQRVEELNHTLRQLTIGHPAHGPHASIARDQFPRSDSSPYVQPTRTPSSSAETETPAGPHTFGEEDQHDSSSKPEYEGESSLFAHAVYATAFLQSALAVNKNPSSRAALEMNSVLNALRKAVDAQKQQTDTLQTLYPNARSLPPGANLRHLPMPDTNKVLACLRMAQGKCP